MRLVLCTDGVFYDLAPDVYTLAWRANQRLVVARTRLPWLVEHVHVSRALCHSLSGAEAAV